MHQNLCPSNDNRPSTSRITSVRIDITDGLGRSNTLFFNKLCTPVLQINSRSLLATFTRLDATVGSA